MTISTFTLLWNHPHHPSPGLSHLPKLKLCPHETLTPPSPCWWHLLPTFCFYESDPPRDPEWNHTIFILPSLVDLTEHNILKVHSHRCSLCQNFLPFYGWIIPHYVGRSHFVYPFIQGWITKLYFLKSILINMFHIYGWVPLLSTWNYHNIVNPLYSI